MLPTALHALAIASLAIALLCALLIAVDLMRRPLRMGVMNAVWPISALFGSVLALAFYLRYARRRDTPQVVAVAKSCLHCGSGCTLGDLFAEGLVGLIPAAAVLTGWHWLFGQRIWASWVLDTLFAFGFGIAFQYFAIAPMRRLGVRDGLKAAVQADIASLAAWQLGMFGVMALAQFAVLPSLQGHAAAVTTAVFWWAMQWAMLGGFAASFPVNAWLLRAGIKEAM